MTRPGSTGWARPRVETGLVTVWHTAPVNSIDDLRKREISVGSSGANSTPSFYARLMNATLGTKMRIVVGYTGQTDVYLAMERGEVDGFPSMFFNTLNATQPAWRTEKKIKVLLQFGLETRTIAAECSLGARSRHQS